MGDGLASPRRLDGKTRGMLGGIAMTDCPSQYSRGRALVVVAGVEDSIAAIKDALTRSPSGREVRSLLVQTEQVLAALRRRPESAEVLGETERAVSAAHDALSSGDVALGTIELCDAMSALHALEC